MAYLLAGPVVAIIGIAAVFFVLRRKSVEKRSMYSARRQQIEHKVKAARQRTLAPHGHVEKPAEATPAEASPFAQAQGQPTIQYEVAAFQAPPAAPPSAPPPSVEPAAEPMPWEQPSIPASAPAAPAYDYPRDQPTFAPAPEEPVWNPAPIPVEAAAPAEPVSPAVPVASASSSSAGGWSIVSTTKESAETVEPTKSKKKRGKAPQATSWELASGDAPGTEDEPQIRTSSGTVRAIAQYAVLVVGLVMVLIGVLVMVANSHVT